MEEYFGPTHGAYIWGRSVHNIRIKRLWCDLTQGIGRKWSAFFFSLKLHYGLLPDLDTHIWLLHYLFLPALNEDVLEWARSWNNHKLRLANHRTCSPRDMFFFGMIENGLRDADDELEDLEEYGIDWEELQNHDTLGHHAEHNPDEAATDDAIQNPFSNDTPHRLSHVEVPETGCPLNAEQLERVAAYVAAHPHSTSRSMNSRRALWRDTLSFVRQLYD
ncbi:hypothetical protein C8F01DRAFT_1208004 [Mycena amicta]|nr:hypothetical protein C8F01DRAFT_1208004 [Mycena amicta]